MAADLSEISHDEFLCAACSRESIPVLGRQEDRVAGVVEESAVTGFALLSACWERRSCVMSGPSPRRRRSGRRSPDPVRVQDHRDHAPVFAEPVGLEVGNLPVPLDEFGEAGALLRVGVAFGGDVAGEEILRFLKLASAQAPGSPGGLSLHRGEVDALGDPFENLPVFRPRSPGWQPRLPCEP